MLILTVLSLLRLFWGLFFCIPLYNQFISHMGKAVPCSVVFLEFILKERGIRTHKMPDVMEKTPQTVRSLRATAGLPCCLAKCPADSWKFIGIAGKEKRTVKVGKSEAAL